LIKQQQGGGTYGQPPSYGPPSYNPPGVGVGGNSYSGSGVFNPYNELNLTLQLGQEIKNILRNFIVYGNDDSFLTKHCKLFDTY
jgi:hypothetical protein